MNEPAPAPQSGDSAPEPRAHRPEADGVILTVTHDSLRRLLAWIRNALTWATWAYVGGLVVLLLALEWWGERNWLLSVLLYAPPQVLLLPLGVLTPLCLIFRWRLLAWHLAAVILLFFGYMNFRWSSWPAPTANTVTAVTFNSGESSRTQFYDFLARENPDLVFMQDAPTRGPELAATMPERSAAHLGRFTFVSRFPLGKPAYIDGAKWQGQSVAARCETVIAGRKTALYSVHLPTPRYQLSRFLGGRRILGDLVGRKDRAGGFASYREWLAARIELARSLAAVLENEPLPMIVAGDFNTPDHGYIYHLMSRNLTDAFKSAGRGWGLTFPGSTRNPITLFGPWLRLDYFFVDHRHWAVTECRPEPGQKSQHKAVLVRLEPRS